MIDGELLASGACTLHDDGCVVCSDAGIPLRVVEVLGDDARCVDALNAEALIAIDLVGPVDIGDVLLTHGGVAIGRVFEPPDRPPDAPRSTWEGTGI